MAVTTVPETTPKQESLWTPTIRRMATWTAVGVAVAAAGVLAVQVFASDRDPASRIESEVRASGVYALSTEQAAYLDGFLAGRGDVRASTSPGTLSPLAIAGLVRDYPTPASTAQRGSITALDHLAEQGATVTDASGLVAERGSITALDHLAEQSAIAGDGSQLVAERGSITAIDHRAEQAEPASETASRTP